MWLGGTEINCGLRCDRVDLARWPPVQRAPSSQEPNSRGLGGGVMTPRASCACSHASSPESSAIVWAATPEMRQGRQVGEKCLLAVSHLPVAFI